MRKRKQGSYWLGCIGFLLAIFMTTAMPVLAASESEWIVDGSRLIDALEDVSETSFNYTLEPETGSEVVPFSTKYLMNGYAQITNAGSGKVTVSAKTKANTVCDKVELDIYLQYYNNGSWSYVNNWNYSVKNKAYLTASRTLSVTKGRYYRIKCYHAVTKNGVKETSITMTNGIPIK